MPERHYIPVYLQDDTLAGQAEIIDVEGVRTEIRIKLPNASKVFDLVEHQLVGLSLVYTAKEAYEVIHSDDPAPATPN